MLLLSELVHRQHLRHLLAHLLPNVHLHSHPTPTIRTLLLTRGRRSAPTTPERARAAVAISVDFCRIWVDQPIHHRCTLGCEFAVAVGAGCLASLVSDVLLDVRT